jgi:hypothetical protein
MARRKHSAPGQKAASVLTCLLLLIASSVQTVHSCEQPAPFLQVQVKGPGITATHGPCQLCLSAASAPLISPVAHVLPELAATCADQAPVEIMLQEAQSYALQVRPPPLS